MLAGVGERVEGVGDEAHPRVADLGGRELGEQPHHVGVQLRAADARVGLRRRDAASEQDAAAVRRCPVIVDHLAGVGEDAVVRDEPRDQRLVEHLGGDDVAADRDDAALVPRRHGAGVAVGGDDEFLRAHHPLRRRHLEAARLAADAGRGTVRHHRHAGGEAALQQALVVAPRVDRGVMGIDEAAVIAVGADLAALLAARHGPGAGLQPLRLLADRAGELLVLHGIVGGVEAADDGEVAGDLLAGDEVLDPGERVAALLQHPVGALALAVAGLEVVEVRLDAGRDLAAVARRAAEAGGLGVDHYRRAPAPGRLQRRVEAGIAGADDEHVRRRRRRHLRQVRPRDVVPPVGGGLEVGGEEIGHARGSLTGRRLDR